MKNKLEQIISYRRKEEEIKKAEVALTTQKCELIRLRQQCRHNVKILIEKEKQKQKYCQCALCGQRFRTDSITLEMANISEVLVRDNIPQLILDSSKYLEKYSEQDKIIRIELICAEHMASNDTTEQNLEKILKQLKSYEI